VRDLAQAGQFGGERARDSRQAADELDRRVAHRTATSTADRCDAHHSIGESHDSLGDWPSDCLVLIAP
jgi:hypothetical protein